MIRLTVRGIASQCQRGRRLIIALWVTCALNGLVKAEVGFNRIVRSILSDHCYRCHGPDPNQRQADLRLDVRDEAIKINDAGRAAIVPGQPSESLVVERIESHDVDAIMPPVDSHKKLSDAHRALLKQWIAEGAKYETHWAFEPLVIVPVPQVRDASWVRNPIDRFILSKIEQQGLAPSCQTEKETLIRRAALDITGLPPTLAQIDAYLLDTSDSAYEKVVDQFLRSEHYGERMAVDWLDAARFADTNGYQVDRDREVYAWRDWVIGAFNRNLPFDQFTIEQFAGDLIPNATLDQKIATGFHRNHMMNEEGGVLPEEFLAEYLADRVETTTAVWLGQTFNCARCHDHKFDPFTQRDFYGLKAFFNAVPEPGRGHYEKPIRESNPPFLALPSPDQLARQSQLQSEVDSLTKQIAALPKVTLDQLDAWVTQLNAQELKWFNATFVQIQADKQSASVSDDRQWLSFDAHGDRNLGFTAKLSPLPASVTAVRLSFASELAESNVRLRDLQISIVARDASSELSRLKILPRVVGNSVSVEELAKAFDTDARSIAVLKLGKNSPASAVFEIAHQRSTSAATVELTANLKFSGVTEPFCMSVQWCEQSSALLVPSKINNVARKGIASLSAEEKKQLLEFRHAQSAEFQALSLRLSEATKQLDELQREIPTTLVMAEMDQPRPTYVLMRGAYDKPGAEVAAKTPEVLPPMNPTYPKNRLGLARWLVDPRNPLTARVTVNRFWQAIFGTGLVRTSEDFGAQGEPPSHPELLDWLAVELMHSGWNVKSLLRTILTSATYRQSSRVTPELLRADPDNRLLARGPRFRLQAEFVRDAALASSGLLVRKLGGPSVKPYHPAGLYEQITAGNGTNTYVVGRGDDLYRRSLYTYWKRSVPNPAMLVFDAPFRETCSLRRPRTNTPLQALNLLNDTTYVEAARFLAERMLREGGSDSDSRITHGFRLLLARRPKAEELRILRDSFERATADFERDPQAAQSLLAIGDKAADASLDRIALAAMTSVASTILNLDEAITKE